MLDRTLGACPRIGILFKIEKFLKNTHSHIVDIGVFAYLRALFFGNSEEFEQVSVDSERAFSDRLLIVVPKGKLKNVYVFYVVDVLLPATNSGS